MPAGKKATLQDIADRTGYCRSTISLALRNHRSIPEETRERIHQAAKTLGYRANPLVAALMTQLRGRKRRYKETIAVVSRMERGAQAPFYRILYEAMEEAARELGYEMDRFYLGSEKLSGPRLGKVLASRGIHGVILFPGTTGNVDYPEIDWEPLTTVLVGFDPNRHAFHQVASNYTYDMDLALRHAMEAGYERVGFAVSEGRDHTTDNGWSSRFLLYQSRLPRSRRISFPPCVRGELEHHALLSWVQKNRPDLLLVAGESVPRWLAEIGIRIPEDLAVLNLVQRGEKGLAGIDPRTGTVGRVAVEFLVSMLQANEHGLPEFPRLIAVQGEWVDGLSCPGAAMAERPRPPTARPPHT